MSGRTRNTDSADLEEQDECSLSNFQAGSSTMDDYPDGSIIRMVFQNFLTYGEVIFTPRKNLNLLVGPNGSGKSSIICGICLVFGGSPKNLGRSEKIADYIRHGCTDAYVEVQIADKARGVQTIRLSLWADAHPKFTINGKDSSQKEVKNVAARYNIQVDNPCAFLAQDKVKSFSEQSPVDLLLNTEKAASADLLEEHQKMIEQRSDEGQFEKRCEQSGKAIQQLTDESVSLEQRVENYQKRKNAERKLTLLEQKVVIMEFAEEEEKMDMYKKRLTKTLRAVEKTQAKVDEKKKLQEDWKKTEQDYRAKVSDVASKKLKLLTEVESSIDQNFVQVKMSAAQHSLDAQRKSYENHEKNVKESMKNVETLKEKLNGANQAMTGYNEFRVRRQTIEAEFEARRRELQRQKDEMMEVEDNMRRIQTQMQSEQQRASQVMENRLRSVNARYPNVYRAYMWYMSNKSLFKGPVHCPLIHMSLHKDVRNDMIEAVVGQRDLQMLICQSAEDESLLHGAVTSGINTTILDPAKIRKEMIEPKLQDELAAMGFKDYLMNTFDAPDIVKMYLVTVSRPDKVPYGTVNETDELIEQLSNGGINVFMTGSRRIQSKRSQFSGELSHTIYPIKSANIFRDPCYRESLNRNMTDRIRLQNDYERLKQKAVDLKPEIAEKRSKLEAEKEVFSEETKEWKKKADYQVICKNAVETESSKLERLLNNKIDLAEAEREFDREQKMVVSSAVAKAHEAKQKMVKLVELSKQQVFLLYAEKRSIQQRDKLYERLQVLTDYLDNAKEEANAAEDEMRRQLANMNEVTKQLRDKCGLRSVDETKCDADEKKILKALKKAFDDYDIPDDENLLIDQIKIEKTKLQIADGSCDGDANDEKKLIEVKRALIEKQAEHDRNVETRDNLQGNLQKAIDNWQHKIGDMIEKINVNYTVYFRKLGCVGEVHLEIPENTLDINKYGIMIMVSFRSGEKMKRLDHNVQSGGERSVSTMLYLLALQHLCPVPFRVVDEINQGMDPTNEKKVFEIMVDSWKEDSGLSKTQYLLLTPKLLPELKMNDKVAVQFVFTNVPAECKEWKITEHLEKMQIMSR